VSTARRLRWDVMIIEMLCNNFRIIIVRYFKIYYEDMLVVKKSN
jgi:hypothetical protein